VCAQQGGGPDAFTVVGGTHPTFLPERCLAEVPALDMIALGEGEPVFLDLLDALNAGRSLSGVEGLAYREDGGVRVNPKTKLVRSTDAGRVPS